MSPDTLRWICVAIAGLDVAVLTTGSIFHWHTFNPRLKRIVPWVIATYVLIAYGFGEVAASHTEVPPGLRLPMFLLVLSGLLVALLYRITEE